MSHRIMFWNTQRLSNKSPEEKRVIACKIIRESKSSDTFLCEVLNSLVEPQTYRRNQDKRQLGIGRFDLDLLEKSTQGGGDMHSAFDKEGLIKGMNPLDVVVPEEYARYGYKGGMDFSKMVDRKPCYVDRHGIRIIVWHAPASTKATRALLMLMLSLIVGHDENALWMIVGDLNVDPNELRNSINERIESGQVNEVIANRIISYIKYARTPLGRKMPTHIRRNRESTLDYVITNIPKVRISARSARYFKSRMPNFFEYFDHIPIFVDLPRQPEPQGVQIPAPGGVGIMPTPILPMTPPIIPSIFGDNPLLSGPFASMGLTMPPPPE